MGKKTFEEGMEQSTNETLGLTKTKNSTGIALKDRGVGIEGLEEVPASIIPIPYVRLVQPTSQNTTLSSGEEAKIGEFILDDTKEQKEKLYVSILKAKHGEIIYDRDGEKSQTQKIAILSYDLEEEKLFIISLSVMSFSNFGSLIARLKKIKASKIYEYEITVTSEKQENEKGKYWVAKFELGNKLEPDVIEKVKDLATNYNSVLDKRENTNDDSDVSSY